MSKLKSAYSIFFLLFTAFIFLSNSTGRPGNWAAAPGDNGFCSTCHTSSAAGSIQLVGAPTAYTPGQTYNMTIVLANATALVGGFQIVATNGLNNSMVGDFLPTAGTTLNDVLRLVQSTPKAFAGGTTSWDISWQAPNSGGPANVQFYFAGNAANGNMNNGAGDFAYANTSGLIPLPLNLLSFEVRDEEGKINLQWTASEIENHSHFEIQQSLDGKTFSSIGELDSDDDRSEDLQAYNYIDDNPVKGATNYYRLKSVDLDGQYFYSEIRSIAVDETVVMMIYPNPLSREELLNINIKDFKSTSEYEVQIIDTNGQLVKRSPLSFPEAHLSMNQFPPGLYSIHLIRDGVPVWVERAILL